jgi:hypothetical protein
MEITKDEPAFQSAGTPFAPNNGMRKKIMLTLTSIQKNI